MPSSLDTDAILLFAHGSRAPDLKMELAEVCRLVKDRSGARIVEACFLDLAEPDLYYGVKMCVSNGAKKIVVVPYLLNVGTHLRRDLPILLDKVRKEFSSVQILLAPHLGVDPALAGLVVRRAEAAREGDDPI